MSKTDSPIWVKAIETPPDGIYYCRFYNTVSFNGDIILRGTCLVEDGKFITDFNVDQIEYLDESPKEDQQPQPIKSKEEILQKSFNKYRYASPLDGQTERPVYEAMEEYRNQPKDQQPSGDVVELVRDAHWHGWFVRERYTGPDRHGYEDKLPKDWGEMDYEEHETWFANQFIEKHIPKPQADRGSDATFEKLLETVKIALSYRDFGVLNEYLVSIGENKIPQPIKEDNPAGEKGGNV